VGGPNDPDVSVGGADPGVDTLPRSPDVSIGDADPGLDTLGPDVVVGDADPEAQTVRKEPGDPEAPAQLVAEPAPRGWALAAHATALLALIGVPLGNLVGPGVVYLLRRGDPVLAEHARRALNFQLTATGVTLLLLVTVVGALAIPLIVLVDVVCVVMASLAALEGAQFEYPRSWNVVKA